MYSRICTDVRIHTCATSVVKGVCDPLMSFFLFSGFVFVQGQCCNYGNYTLQQQSQNMAREPTKHYSTTLHHTPGQMQNDTIRVAFLFLFSLINHVWTVTNDVAKNSYWWRGMTWTCGTRPFWMFCLRASTPWTTNTINAWKYMCLIYIPETEHLRTRPSCESKRMSPVGLK